MVQSDSSPSWAPPQNADMPGVSHRGLGNWIWLAELDCWKRALQVGCISDSLAAALRIHFCHVYNLPLKDTLDFIKSCDAPATSQWHFQDGAFDCVTLHGGFHDIYASHSPNVSQNACRRVLQQCHRVLRPGGCLYIATANPTWLGRRSPRRLVFSYADCLKQLGFRTVRRFYTEPSYDIQISIIPASRRAVLAHQGTTARTARGRLPKKLATHIGLHNFLYPGLIQLAYK